MKNDRLCAKITAEGAPSLLLPRPEASLITLLACSGLLLVLWSFAVPIFETPDELSHWKYAQYLHEHKKLPFYDSHSLDANQPPLYYLFVAPFASSSVTPPPVAPPLRPRLFLNTWGDFKQYWSLRLTRLVTCILSLLTVCFAYLSGVEATGNRSTGILAGGLTAFLPQFTFRGMSISNDAMVAATSAVAVYLIIRLVKRGFTPMRGIFTSIVITAAFLSKINAIALLFPFTLAVLVGKGRWLERLGRFWVLGIGIVLAAPWLVRNLQLYGDPLATKAFWTAVPEFMVHRTIDSPFFRTEFPSLLWRSFVGMFGWMNLPMPELFYQFFLVLGLLGATGYMWRLIRRPADRCLGAVLVSLPVTTLLLVIQLNLIQTSASQGRYMFPALTAIALLAAMGLEALPRWNRSCTLAVIILAGVVNVGVLGGTVIPAYWTFPENYALRIDVAVTESEVRMPAGPLISGTSYAQSFVARHQNLAMVEMEVATYARKIASGVLKMHLRQSLNGSDDVASSTIQLNTIKDNSFVGLRFPPIRDSKGKTYYIVLETLSPSDPVTLWLSSGNVYPEGAFFVNGQVQPHDTCFYALYDSSQQL